MFGCTYNGANHNQQWLAVTKQLRASINQDECHQNLLLAPMTLFDPRRIGHRALKFKRKRPARWMGAIKVAISPVGLGGLATLSSGWPSGRVGFVRATKLSGNNADRPIGGWSLDWLAAWLSGGRINFSPTSPTRRGHNLWLWKKRGKVQANFVDLLIVGQIVELAKLKASKNAQLDVQFDVPNNTIANNTRYRLQLAGRLVSLVKRTTGEIWLNKLPNSLKAARKINQTVRCQVQVFRFKMKFFKV